LEPRLGPEAPAQLHLLGVREILHQPLTALFSSARCPGEAILRTFDQAARWRDLGHAVISGFHSPMERECLKILLRGRQPVVICPARGLPVRVSAGLKPALEAGRLLFVTPFPAEERRVTFSLAERRNFIAAALATEIWFAHIAPGGRMEHLAQRVGAWSTHKRA
jgi:hypothetical protein